MFKERMLLAMSTEKTTPDFLQVIYDNIKSLNRSMAINEKVAAISRDDKVEPLKIPTTPGMSQHPLKRQCATISLSSCPGARSTG